MDGSTKNSKQAAEYGTPKKNQKNPKQVIKEGKFKLKIT